MHKRSFIMALAAGLVACSMSATGAIAGTVEVLKDAGTFSFTLTATSGNLNIQYSGVDLTSINGNTIPSVLSQLHGVGPEDVIVTSTMTSGAFTSYTLNDVSPGIKTFGISPGITSAASLEYQLFTGSAVNPGFFNLNGTILSVVSPVLQVTPTSTAYDFSNMAGGSMALTFNQVNVDFAALIAGGGTVTGTGGFSEAASVPEPTSMALLGIGMTAVFAFRRYFKRNTIA